jgi:FkbM family methyltransferase
MVFYDLGANLGFFSLLAARMVGASGKVFSFEADPEMARRLQDNVERNKFQNVRVIQKAVWSSTGSVRFSRADATQSPDLGWGKVACLPAAAEETIALPSTSLDDFARTDTPPDFIKCDVEGAEVEVFAAARNVLTEHRPLVACEVHSSQNAVRLTQLFEELHYFLRWFTKNHFVGSPQSLS